MTERKSFDLATRMAIWEAHGKRCAYTGEPLDFSELQIDHVVPIEGDVETKAGLRKAGVTSESFDFNGFENLLPTKGFRNRQKTDFIPNFGSVVFFLTLAAKNKAKVEKLYSQAIEQDRALNSYLRLKVQAEKNDLSVEDMVDVFRHQTEGEIRLRVAPEVDGQELYSANSAVASTLSTVPFALGGGSITEVTLHDGGGQVLVCRTTAEFRDAKRQGFYGLSQFEMNAYALADRTSEILRAIEAARFAPRSSIRFPRVTLRNLEAWSTNWLDFVPSPDTEDGVKMLLAEHPTLAQAVNAGLARVKDQDDWSLDLAWEFGFPVKLTELLRADLDGDGEEELLVSQVAYAEHGTFRASKIVLAKVDASGVIQPAEFR